MWYGYVGPGTQGVYTDWKDVERLATLFPYSKFRKFHSEDEAWGFVARNKRKNSLKSITQYGDTFKRMYVTVEYFVRKTGVYYNIDTSRLGHIKIMSEDKDVVIENRTEKILVHIKNINLNNDLVISHAIAIYQILALLGEYVDVEIVVPDQSIFYLLSAYTGDKPSYVRILNSIKNRKGNISITIKDW